MGKKKKIIKQPSGSLKVDHKVLKEVKDYCKSHGILVTHFGTEALKDRLLRVKSF
jgi:hypothetical protein